MEKLIKYDGNKFAYITDESEIFGEILDIEFSRDEIKNMTSEEYNSNRESIMKSLSKGKIK
jgi:hypothetical protein